MKRGLPLADRFWPMVRKTKSCWIWLGYRDKDGYGTMHVHRRDGLSSCRADGVSTPRRAHRISYEMKHGPVPHGLMVLHSNSCNRPSCVRPDHLYLGTAQQNMDDREDIGHTYRGTQHSLSKLNGEAVREIRMLYRPRGQGGMSMPKLAMKYGVNVALIHRIIRRKSWAHIA